MTQFDIDAWQIGRGTNPPGGYSMEGTPFDEYWNNLPSLKNEERILHVNGHSFQGRMAVLKFLIFEIDPASLWSDENREWHWLWAYAAQLDWQHRSGRLHIGEEQLPENSDKLSTTSWWNYMNFLFSVCILLGAQQSGLIQVESIQLDRESDEFVTEDPAVQQCISSWERLFRNAYQTFKENMSSQPLSNRDVADSRFEFQRNAWMAHTNVIRYTIGLDSSNLERMTPRLKKLLDHLPEPERKFGLGWCRMVEILAACCFPTDLVALIEDGAGNLPIEIVTDERFEEWSTCKLKGQALKRFESILVTHSLLSTSDTSLHRIVRFWHHVVRTSDISRAMPATIKELSNGTLLVKLKQVTRILFLFARPRKTDFYRTSTK
jgi:hypothetical protein